MAKLLKCKECGHSVSRSAKNCPGCGAKMSRQRTSAGTWLVFVLLMLVFYTWSQIDESTPSRSTYSSPSTASSPGGAPQRTGPSWTYSTSKDDLTDEVVHYAHFRASKGFIYDVGAWVRCKSGSRKFEIIFEVGDFIGSGDSGCNSSCHNVTHCHYL